MPLGHFNVENLNLNSQRRFPLADTADGIDATGSFKLPQDFLVALDLPVQAGMDVDPARFFIRNIGVYPTGYSVIVAYQPSDLSSPINVATALIPKQAHVQYAEYALGGMTPFADTNGKLTVDKLTAIDDQPGGYWTFAFENGRLDPMAIRPYIRGVSGLVVVNNGQRSRVLRGIIEIEAGTNTQLVPIIASGENPKIRINFIQGEGTVESCVCEGEARPTQPITSLNGIRPTADGDYTLVGGECIQITPIANGLRIENTCAKPCCSCPELEDVTRDLERLNTEVAGVNTFKDQLAASTETFSVIVLGAKLGDRSCLSCE